MPLFEDIDKSLSILLAVLTLILVLGGILAILILNIRENFKRIFNKTKRKKRDKCVS